MKKGIFTLTLTIALCLIFCAAYSEKKLSELNKSGIVRLHIVANSNEADDQRLKLEIRDEILRSDVFDGKYNLKKAEKICNEKIKAFGKKYDCRIETGNFYFPTKVYKNIALPAGKYNALKIILGEGRGKNWWCVMYPPLCFSENASGELSKENEEKLKEMLGDKNYNLISDESVKIVPAFKIVEIWQEIKESIKNKD